MLLSKYKLSISQELIKLSNGVKLGPHTITKFLLLEFSLFLLSIKRQSKFVLSLVIIFISLEF